MIKLYCETCKRVVHRQAKRFLFFDLEKLEHRDGFTVIPCARHSIKGEHQTNAENFDRVTLRGKHRRCRSRRKARVVKVAIVNFSKKKGKGRQHHAE